MGKHHTADHVEADALRMGFVKTRIGPDYHTVRWHLKCSKCPQDFTASWDAGMKPEAMARQVRKRQWDVDYGMRPLCPKCAHSKDKGPVPKPEHQSFGRWIPPQSLIFDRLLDAANKRAAETLRPQLVEKIAEGDKYLATLKTEVKEIRATMAEEERLAGQRARMANARTMRLQRIAEKRAAEAASAQAVRKALLREAAPARAEVQSSAPDYQAPQANQETAIMKPTIAPAPKIAHAVFQCLDGVFDPIKRLYKSGYTDQRVAKECGTAEDVVAYLRTETFGQLAEDPRYSALRDDLDLLRMEAAETFARLQKTMGEISSRVEQLARS